MCGSMVDIQSPTAEIRRGKKEEEETTRWKYNVASATQGGHKKSSFVPHSHHILATLPREREHFCSSYTRVRRCTAICLILLIAFLFAQHFVLDSSIADREFSQQKSYSDHLQFSLHTAWNVGVWYHILIDNNNAENLYHYDVLCLHFDLAFGWHYKPWVKKGCHPNRGYNFVNSWSICKFFSLLQKAVNFQQNQY